MKSDNEGVAAMKDVASLYDPEGLDDIYQPLKDAGLILDYKPILKTAGEDELIDKLSGYSYIIAAGENYTARVIRTLAQNGLKLIVRMGIGYDNVDTHTARECGVDVANTPGANAEAVAEQALMLTLCAARSGGKDNIAMHQGIWEASRPVDLFGCTVGLVGFGSIAAKFAALIRPLAGKILAYDPYPNAKRVEELNVEIVSFERLITESDVVSLHLPLTEQTEGLFNEAVFRKMKSGAILINTSRGSIINENALVIALKEGKLHAAGLDVFCTEPLPPDSPLRLLDNCVMSPHDASMSNAAFRSMTAAVVRSILAKVNGTNDINIVN